MKNFYSANHQPQIKKYEINCCWPNLLICLLTIMAYFSFHPFFGDSPNLPLSYIHTFSIYTRIFLYIVIFVEMVILIYMQLIPLCISCYITYILLIYSYKLRNYIKTNLCKKYENFDVIRSTSEQDSVYYHLKMCTKYHQLLKKLVQSLI